jgi:uncharacterized protein (TIGR02266 family)
MDDNRRKYTRTAVSVLVQLCFDASEEVLVEYSADVSPGGIFIRTPNPRPIGSGVHVQFLSRDGAHLIQGMGKVAHINPPGSELPGMGIEFLDLHEEMKAWLQTLCSGQETG